MPSRLASQEKTTEWMPQVRRINAPDVGEQGKLRFIRSLIGERRFDEALEELRQLLYATPRSYLGNINMGRLLERKGEVERAVEHFEAARAANPTRVEAPLLAGKAYITLKDLDHSGEAFEAALGLDPKQASAHLGMAQVHFFRNDLAQAEKYLGQALTLDPQLKQAHTLQVRIHKRRSDDNAAQQSIEEILKSGPNRVRPVIALARIHLRSDRVNEAIELLESAAGDRQDNDQLWLLLGRAKLSGKDYAGAEKAFTRALEIDPRKFDIALHLIDTLIPQGKVTEAKKLLDRLPEMARRRGRVQATYAKVHMAAQQYKQAAASYRAALLRRKDGEAIVTEIAAQIPRQGDVDWKTIAEGYQAKLREVRRAAAEDGERTTRRRAQAKRERTRAWVKQA